MYKMSFSPLTSIGLHSAGQTTLLYRLTLGRMLTNTAMFGFSQDTIRVKDVSIALTDLGYRVKGPAIARSYLLDSHGVVYVIDSSNRKWLGEALDELIRNILLEEKIKGMVIMVLANKQDVPGAMTALEIQEALKQKYTFSSTSASAHTMFVRPCSVLTMEGVDEALEEFVEQLRLKYAGKATLGLIPLDKGEDDVNVKDVSINVTGDSEKERKTDTDDGLVARMGIKSLCRDPFSFLRSVFN